VARPVVPDTTIFIRFLRRGDGELALHREIRSERLWLSSVVAGELYAGTRSRDDARILDRFVRTMTRIGRIVTPSTDDWLQAGQMLARRSRLAGDLRPRDHLADVLILVSAARINGSVVTINLNHFEAWLEIAKDAGMDVTVEGPS
jgi:predicted nucleic acid-binding protein